MVLFLSSSLKVGKIMIFFVKKVCFYKVCMLYYLGNNCIAIFL